MMDDQYHVLRVPVMGAGGGKSGSSGGGAEEDDNTLLTRSQARFLELLGEGPIGGLVNGFESMYFGDTPVQASDGTFNFEGITVYERIGEPDQAPIPGFDEVESEVPVGVEVLFGVPVVRTIGDSDVDAVRVKIQFPGLTSTDKENGDLHGATVEFRIERRIDGGGWELVHDISITDKATSVAELGWRVTKPEGATGDWDVRVERVTEDSDDSALNNKISFSAFTQLTEARLYYPYSAMLGIEIDAEQFGSSVPSRKYDVWGHMGVPIPANYDPILRTYSTEIWDGEMTTNWTNNPVWLVYLLLQDKRFGLGHFMSEAALSSLKWDLYEIGKYCDELVSDGRGGVEPRFSANGVIDKQYDAMTLLNSLASVFRGMIYWGAGAVKVGSDRPGEPIRLVNRSNVVGGNFERPGTRLRDKSTVVRVSYNDPDDGYRQAIEVVENAALIRRHGYRAADVSGFLCTSRAQARRVGEWILHSQNLEPVIFQCGRDMLDVRPGDILKISDPEEIGARWGGRIVSATVSEIEIDAPVDLAFGVTYFVQVRLPDGSLVSSELSNDGGPAQFLELVTDFEVAPVAAAAWVMWSDEVEPELVRVLTVTEEDAKGGVYQFDCLTHNPSIYDAVDNGALFEVPKTSLIPVGPLPSVTDLSLEEYLFKNGPSAAGAVTISWLGVRNDPRVSSYLVEVARPNENFKAVGQVRGTSVDLRDVSRGVYRFRVAAVNQTGGRGAWVVIEKDLYGLAAAPATITGLKISKMGGLAVLSWAAHIDLDVLHGGNILIRHSSSGLGVGSSIGVGNPLPGGDTQAVVPLQAGTYYLQARDSGGRLSAVAAEIATDAASVIPYSNLDFVQAEPSWSGVLDGTIAAGDDLLTMTVATGNPDPDELSIALGSYTMAAGLDLGSVKSVRLSAVLSVYGTTGTDLISTRAGVVSDWASFAGEVSGGFDGRVEIRLTNDDPSGSPVWGAWQELLVSEYEMRALEARLILQIDEEDVAVSVQKFQVHADEVA